MCEPTTLMAIGLAISAASAGVSYKQGQNAAKTQEESIQRSAEMQNIQTAQGYEQQSQAAMEQSSQRHQDWLRDLGRLRTVGAESGLVGNNEQRLENETTMQAQNDLATVEANRMKGTLNAGSEAAAGSLRASAQLTRVRRPSLVGTGLQIAGTATDAGLDYRRANPLPIKGANRARPE